MFSITGISSNSLRSIDGLDDLNLDQLYINGTLINFNNYFDKTIDTTDNITEGKTNKWWYDAYTTSAPLSKVDLGGGYYRFDISQSTTGSDGYLNSTDWNIFNNKENVLSFTAPLQRTGNTISITQASGSTDGYITSSDYNNWSSSASHWTPVGSLLNSNPSYNCNFTTNAHINGTKFIDTSLNLTNINTLTATGAIVGGSFNTAGLYYANGTWFVDSVRNSNFNTIAINSTQIVDASRNFSNVSSLTANGTIYTSGVYNSGAGYQVAGISAIDLFRNGSFLSVDSTNEYKLNTTTIMTSARTLVNIYGIQSSGTNSYTGQSYFYNSIYMNGYEILNISRDMYNLSSLTTNTLNSASNAYLYGNAWLYTTYVNGILFCDTLRNLTNVSSINLATGSNNLMVNGSTVIDSSRYIYPVQCQFDSHIIIRSNNSTPMIRIGYQAGPNISGVGSIAIGNYAAFQLYGGNYNTHIGNNAAYTSLGQDNSTYGSYAGYSLSSGNECSYFGSACGYLNSGSGNTGMGFSALGYGSSSGGNNCAFGLSAMRLNTTASGGCAFGREAMYNNTTGAVNCGYGYQALFSNITGGYNTAIGYQAGYNILEGNNVCIGRNAAGTYNSAECTQVGALTGNSGCGYGGIALGYASNSVGSISQALGFGTYCNANYGTCLGYNVSSASDPQNYAFYLNTNLPAIGGSWQYLGFNTSGRVGYVSSSIKFKTNVITFNKNSIDLIDKLRPVYYEDKVKAPKGEKQPQHIGLIAEEVYLIVPEVVPCNKDGPMTVLYDRLVPILIDALQKLNKRVEILEKKRR